MAASVIGALRVNLGIDTAAFSNGLKGSEGSLKKFAANAAKGIAVAAAAFTAAAAGVALAVRGILNEADEMGKSAQSFGVPVEELSRLKHAAEMSGSSMEGLSTGLKRLGATIAKSVSKPTSAAGKAFRALDIDLKNADGTIKNSSQVMSDLAEKLAQMPDGAEKTALAMQLMGKSGADLIPMLNGGRDALQAMKDEADELGIVIDQKTATAAANFNDNLARLSAMVKGIWTQLTAELAPALQAISDYFVGAAKEAGGFGDTIKTVADIAVDAALVVVDAWSKMEAVWAGLEVAAYAFESVVREITKSIAVAITTVVDGMLTGVNAMISAANAIGFEFEHVGLRGSDWFKTIDQNASNAAANLEAARARMNAAWEAPLPSVGIREAIAAMDEVEVSANTAAFSFTEAMVAIEAGSARAAAGAKAAAQSISQMAAEGERIRQSLRTPLEEFNDTMTRLNQLLQAGAIDWETYERAVEQAQDKFDQAKEKGSQLASTLSNQFSSMFSGLIDGTKSAGEAITGLLKQLAQLVINKAFQAMFAGGLGSGGLGGFFSGLFGGARADGGPVRGGRTYLVGERGPELITPSSSGTVIPNHMLGGGGSGIVVNITNNAKAEVRTREGQGANGPTFDVIIDEMVADKVGTPGSASRRALQANGGLRPQLARR